MLTCVRWKGIETRDTGVQSDDDGQVMIVTPDEWEFSDFPIVGVVDTVRSKPSLSSVHVYPLHYVNVNVSGCECVALEDSGCQIPIVSERMFAWCCDKVVGKVTLHGFGKSHTVQAPLVKLVVRVSDKDCGDVAEVSLVSEFNLSVESNKNVESKRKSVESRNEKCGVQDFAKSQCNDDDWRVPYISVKRRRLYKCPPPTIGPNICIVFSSSLIFSKKFLARYDRSIACNRRN